MATTQEAGASAAKSAKKVSKTIRKTVVKKPKKPVVVKAAKKFRKKGVTKRGPKRKTFLIDQKPIIELITKGIAPQNAISTVASIVGSFDQPSLKSLVRQILPLMSEKTRKSILAKYLVKTKVQMDPQDKKDLLLGRRMRKMATSVSTKK